MKKDGKHLYWRSRHWSCLEGDDFVQHCEVRTYWADERASVYDCHHADCPCDYSRGKDHPPKEC